MPDTAKILVNVYDGTRRPLGSDVSWTLTAYDGQSVQTRHSYPFVCKGSSALIEVPFFDNLFDNYIVIASRDGYNDAGWMPVRISSRGTVAVYLMLLPKDGKANFAGATWDGLNRARPLLATFVQNGCENANSAADKYAMVLEQRPDSLACFLNIMTALADMRLPSGKSPLDYYWNLALPSGECTAPDWLGRLDEVLKQDRFFCYVDAAILPDVRNAAKLGAFSQEADPQNWGHDGATESYKQIQFDVSNVQLTFHGRDCTTFSDSHGTRIPCVKIEPDIDYYKDLLAHGLLEVVPNAVTHGLTDPKVAYSLRWMAAWSASLPEFNPIYTVQV